MHKVFRIKFDSGLKWFGHTSGSIGKAAASIATERGFYGPYKVEQVNEFNTADKAAAEVKRTLRQIKKLKRQIKIDKERNKERNIEYRLLVKEKPPHSIRAWRG